MVTILPVENTHQFMLVGARCATAKDGGEMNRQTVNGFFKLDAIFFLNTLRTKIEINIEERNRTAQHSAIFTVYGSTLCVHFAVFKVQAIAQRFPISTFNPLNEHGLPKNADAQYEHQQVDQVTTP